VIKWVYRLDNIATVRFVKSDGIVEVLFAGDCRLEEIANGGW